MTSSAAALAVDDLRAISLFDGLTDDQVGDLVAAGAAVRIEPGVDLFREGDQAEFWWVLIDGAIDLLRHVGREDTVGRKDGRPRSVGRRVPRVGRARCVPGDRPRGAQRDSDIGQRRVTSGWFAVVVEGRTLAVFRRRRPAAVSGSGSRP
jgi:hypothetical protein